MGEIPDMQAVVEFILTQVSFVVTLSVLLVGFNNKLKSILPERVLEYMFLVSIATGVGLMFLLREAFIIEISPVLTTFYGIIIGLAASGLYDSGLWKSLSEK